MFRKSTKKNEEAPMRNQSVECWQNWVGKAHWKNVYEAWQNFVPRGYEPYVEHDKQVIALLEKRLLRIEFPICAMPLKVNHLEVPNGIGSLELKKLVKSTQKTYPYVLIEYSGRYRGIALAPDLIFIGTCWLSLSVADAVQKAKELKLEFLTETDSRIFEQHFQETNHLLETMGVPTCWDIRSWLVAPMAPQPPYRVWQLSLKNRQGEIGDETPTHLFVKL